MTLLSSAESLVGGDGALIDALPFTHCSKNEYRKHRHATRNRKCTNQNSDAFRRAAIASALHRNDSVPDHATHDATQQDRREGEGSSESGRKST